MIATTIPGRWFGFLDSTGSIAVFTDKGVEPVSFKERVALRQILLGSVDDAA